MALADKQLFAPMPLRAMAADLSGLQLRVLLCVASHDRMSLSTGKGQGCRASNERMKEMVGCNYARMCSTLSELVDLRFLHREKLGRHTVYRVIYTDDDRLLFRNASRAEHVAERRDERGQHVANIFREPAENSQKQPNNIFPERGGIHSVETGKENTLKVRDAIASRGLGRNVLHRDGEPLGETLAKFERQFKADWSPYRGKLAEWAAWLREQSEYAHDNEDSILGYRAQRMAEDVESFAWEIGEIVDDVTVQSGGQG